MSEDACWSDPRDFIVKDSSIYQDSESFSLDYYKDATVKLGIVREPVKQKGEDIHYIVEIWLGGKWTPVKCPRSCRFGGVYNYEEYTLRGFDPGDNPAADGLMDYKAGDQVLVAYIGGDSREAVILTHVNHPGRKRLFAIEDDIAYQSEFNGLNKSISKLGEYKVTYKGIQTNIDKLLKPVTGDDLPAPEHNEKIAGSYYEFNKDGSFTISDATEDVQSIFIDKPNGKMIITSGKTSLVIDKKEESYTINNKKTTFNSADEWNLNTKATNIKSTEVINAEAADIKTKGNITQEGNVEITGNTKQSGNVEIDGQLQTTGPTFLAGGDYPLIYDIVLTIGTGNLGAPVVSNHIFLKTVKTKAS